MAKKRHDVSRTVRTGLNNQGAAVITHTIVRTTIGRRDDKLQGFEVGFGAGLIGDFGKTNKLVSLDARPAINTFGVIGDRRLI